MTTSLIIPYRYSDPQRDAVFRWTADWWRSHTPDLDISEVIWTDSAEDDEEQGAFNRAAARNLGARETEGDILIFADADSIAFPAAIRTAIIRAKTERRWVLPYDCYLNIDKPTTDRVLAEPPHSFSLFGFNATWEHRLRNSMSGILVMQRSLFEEAGGYDERFKGWGYEDNAFACALSAVAGPGHRVPGTLWHLWHPAPESERFGQPHIEENRQLAAEYERRSPQRIDSGVVQIP